MMQQRKGLGHLTLPKGWGRLPGGASPCADFEERFGAGERRRREEEGISGSGTSYTETSERLASWGAVGVGFS